MLFLQLSALVCWDPQPVMMMTFPLGAQEINHERRLTVSGPHPTESLH